MYYIYYSLSVCIDKVVVVKVSVCMQFMCEMMHVSVGQELRERVKHTKRLHLQLTVYLYITIDYVKLFMPLVKLSLKKSKIPRFSV